VPTTTTVIIGAGHCGLAMSHCLAARSIDHVILERGEVANSWRTGRRDSLRLLTPNWMTRLPGYAYRGADPDGYLSARQVTAMLGDYADASGAPVLTGTTVTSVRAAEGGYAVRTDQGTWRAPAVVLACGAIEMRNPALDAWGDYDRDDPYPLFAQVRADGPVHEVTLADGHRAWLIVRHEEAKAALNHAGLSKDMHAALARDGAVVAEGLPGPAFARHMLSVDPPDHTRLRQLASAAFSRPRIAALRPRVQAIVDGLLDDLEARGDTAVDLVKGFAFPLPFTVISELVGVPEPDQDRLGNWFTTLLAPSSAPEPPAEAVAASANIVRYLTGLLARKRAAPGEDLVTDLVRAADQHGALTEQEMLSTIFQLVVAGHDTTASLIGNGTAALLTHPEQRDALVADPAQVPHAIEEILRWDAPVPHSTFRYTTQDVALGGAMIPAFAQVIISLAAANRDPARYDHPEILDITRADTSHLAFGHGIHHCLGARLARLEGVIALTTLHGRFPAMRLAVPRSALHWGHGDGLVLRGPAELPVILSP